MGYGIFLGYGLCFLFWLFVMKFLDYLIRCRLLLFNGLEVR